MPFLDGVLLGVLVGFGVFDVVGIGVLDGIFDGVIVGV